MVQHRWFEKFGICSAGACHNTNFNQYIGR